MIDLRPITPSDQGALMHLMQRIYPPAYAHFWPDDGAWYVESQFGEENFSREIQAVNAEYHFVLQKDLPVGIIRLLCNVSPPEHPEKRAMKLHRLYLDQAVQGRGLGRQAIEWAIGRARTTGHELLWLEAMTCAPRAIDFYTRMGFMHSASYTLHMPLMHPEMRGMCRMELAVPGILPG
ncbi:GNAT superfamily N-acetyltransferase [Lewinella aquimaris]|uniref:GNAT superfamily N-acetyltransferase n=1 Tax=Neolewinella aquimaris TaxID=1835722 RepID=A0A840EDS8_9BACT|nr:GNAT family N-acetyltransferase [Neolewinella aquimaris]MBB4080118.1 GNAT superfamily N-acetyltransferase [Neolewinella aquimaris]